jgi:hypothetical protein
MILVRDQKWYMPCLVPQIYIFLSSRPVRADTGVRVRGYGPYTSGEYAGGRYNGFFSKKKCDRPFSNPYPSTRLYPGTDTDTADTGHGYTGRDCAQRVLANPYVRPCGLVAHMTIMTWSIDTLIISSERCMQPKAHLLHCLLSCNL